MTPQRLVHHELCFGCGGRTCSAWSGDAAKAKAAGTRTNQDDAGERAQGGGGGDSDVIRQAAEGVGGHRE